MKALGQNGVLLHASDPIKENGSVPAFHCGERGGGVRPGRAQSTCELLAGAGEGLGERVDPAGLGRGLGRVGRCPESGRRLLTGEHRLADAVGHGAGPQQQLQRRAHAPGPGGQPSR